MNQESEGSSQKFNPGMGTSKSQTSIYSKYPPNFTRALTGPTKSPLLLQRASIFLDMLMDLETGRSQKQTHNKENSPKPVNLIRLLSKTKRSSSNYSPQQVKRCTKPRLHSSKEKRAYTVDPRLHTVMAPNFGSSSGPIKSSSEITCPDSKSPKTSPEYFALPKYGPPPMDLITSRTTPKHFALPKCGSPQKSPDTLNFFPSRRKSSEHNSIRKSTSIEKLSNGSKSPDLNRSYSGSRAHSPECRSTRKSSSPKKHQDSSSTVSGKKSPHQKSFINKIYPGSCLKSKSNSPQSSPKSSVMKPFNSHSRKTSPERYSRCKSVSPERRREPPKPQDCPNKSNARRPHLIPRKNVQKSMKTPRKVRYKISTSKSYVKYTKPKSFKKNESRLRPMPNDIEVLYLTEFNCLVDKFMNSVMGKPCPVLKERLKSHQQKCLRRTKCDSKPAQTKCTIADTKRLSHKCCDKNRLKNVHAIVNMWLDKIPVQTSGDARSSAVQELINRIEAIEKFDVDDICYQRSVNIATDRYLNEIRIYHPGPREDKNAFKNGLKKYLVLKLQQNRKENPQKDQMIKSKPDSDKEDDTKGSAVFNIYDQAAPSVNFMGKSAMHRSNQRSSCSSKPSPTKSHVSTYSGEYKRKKGTLNLNSSARYGDASPDLVDSFSNLTRKEEIDQNTSNKIHKHPYNSKFKDICETATQINGNTKDKLLKHEINCLKTINKLKIPPTGNTCLGDNSMHKDFNECLSRKYTYITQKHSGRYRRYDRDNLDFNENNDCETKTASYNQNKNECVNSQNMSLFNHSSQHKNSMVCGDACPRIEKNKTKHFHMDRNYLDIEKVIDNWLQKYTFAEQYAGVAGCCDKSKVRNALLKDWKQYFNQPNEAFNKSFWKGRIITILKSFYAGTGDPMQYESFITRFADDLAKRFVEFLSQLQCIEGIQWNYDESNKCYDRSTKNSDKVIIGPNVVVNQEVFRLALLSNIDECFKNKHFAYNKQIKETILDLLMGNIGLIQNDLNNDVKHNIIDIIKETNILSNFEIEYLVDNILKSCKDLTMVTGVIKNNTNKTELHYATKRSHCTSVSVLTSLNDMRPSFNAVTSTPKKKPKNLQYVSHLNPEQQAYTENIKKVIKSWVDSSPPNFKYRTGPEDMTEVMIEDLSGEICDHFRLEQIINRFSDKEQVITIYIYKWLLKYEVVENIKFAESYTKELVTRILQITVPNMSRPQHGNRQDIEMIKQAANTQWTEPYYPQVQDILEDEISVFMNEYPTEIYVDTDKNARVHELAEKIQPKLDKANSKKEVEKEVNLWMKTMVLPRLHDRADDMANSLVKRLRRVPHDSTLAQYGEKVKEQRLRKQREKYERKDQQEVVEQGPTTPLASKHNDSQDDNDKTMTRFVAEYLNHCHAEEDPQTKKMFAQILQSELRRLDPNALKEVYENKKYEHFNAEKLNKELMYIKEVSDWLKTIPMDSFYNTVENTDRADFVLGVAKNIMEVEEERLIAPDAMDYDVYLGHNIAELFWTLPISPSHRDTVHLAVVNLLQRLAALRGDYNIEPIQPGLGILNFIEEFMKRHGPEIADDKLKLEAWSARLLKELKQVLIEGQVQDKEGFEQRLQLVPKPGDESVKQFNLELAYAKEIVDWLKNLEFSNSLDESNVETLAYKMADYKIKCPGDSSKTKDIVKDWVTGLPLNKNEKKNIPTLTTQLANRLEKVTEEDFNAIHPADLSVKLNTNSKRNNRMQTLNVHPNKNKKPADVVLEMVDKWCDSYLSSANVNAVESERIKNILESKIIMKVCEFNSSPTTLNSDVPYAYLLGEEVKKILLSLGLPPNHELISQLTLAIESVRPMFIKEITRYAYKNELENTLDRFVYMPENPTPEDKQRHDEVKDSIISNYLEYKCYIDDENQRQHYTDKMVDVLTDHHYKITNGNYDNIRAECLVDVNRLLHELNQIAEPSDINAVIAENSLKQEVSNFFTQNKNLIKNKEKLNKVKDELSRELIEMEKSCCNEKTDEEIKTVVKRNMKKVCGSIPKAKLEEFVDNLKKNEAARRQTRFSKSDPRNLSLPTHLSEFNRHQPLRNSLPVTLQGYPADYPQSPIAMPKMVPYPPIVLPKNFNASWNASDYSQVSPQNIASSGRSAFSHPGSMMRPGPTQGANMQPPQDTSIPLLPQFNRYPPLNLQTDTMSTWNSTQPNAELSAQTSPAGIPNTQCSPMRGFVVHGPPTRSSTMSLNTVTSWKSLDSGAEFVHNNVEANVHMPPTGVSPVNSPGALSYHSMMQPGRPAGANIQPPQDITIPTLPQFNRFPPLNLPTDTISTWSSTQPNMMQPGHPAGANIQPPQDITIPTLPQFNRFPPLNLPTDTISTWNSTQPNMMQPGHPAGADMQPPQDITIPTLPQFNRFPPLNLPTDTISTWNSTQPNAAPSPQNIPASISHQRLAQVVPPVSPLAQGRPLQVPPSSSPQTGTYALNGGFQPMGPQHRTQIPGEGLRSTRSLGLTTKPPTSEFGAQKSLGAVPYVPCPFMLPMPSCLADTLPQQLQSLQDTINCDCENCMEGYPLELLSGWDCDRPCGPYPPLPPPPNTPNAPNRPLPPLGLCVGPPFYLF